MQAEDVVCVSRTSVEASEAVAWNIGEEDRILLIQQLENSLVEYKMSWAEVLQMKSPVEDRKDILFYDLVET